MYDETQGPQHPTYQKASEQCWGGSSSDRVPVLQLSSIPSTATKKEEKRIKASGHLSSKQLLFLFSFNDNLPIKY
jgi:hypothetical protein